MQSRTVGTLGVRGTDLHYTAQGAPDGLPLILLHGYSDSWRSYLPLMDLLPEHLRVIAISIRGHGDSAKPADGYDIATLADDVVGALDAIGIGQAVVVGHSMGSLVARKIAAKHGARVSRLVLIGAFASIKRNTAADALWHHAVVHLSDPVDPAFVTAFQKSSVALPLPADFLEAVVAESLKVPARVWQAMLRALLSENESHLLRDIAAPTLIIWGDKDGFAGRAEQQILVNGIPDARLVIHAGIGHAPHWEDARRTAADILSFIKEPSALAA